MLPEISFEAEPVAPTNPGDHWPGIKVMNGDEGDEGQGKVKPYGRHFLIQIDDNGELDTIARLPQIDAKTYGVSFKSHTGRWDPLPEEGSCDEMITMLVEQLGPYLDPANYQRN